MSINKGGRPRGYVMSQATKDMISTSNAGNENKFRKTVSINGTTYPSILEASRALNIARGTVTNRINSTNTLWEKWTYL